MMEAFLSEKILWNQIKESLQKSLKKRLVLSVLDTVTLESFTSNGDKHFIFKAPSSLHQKVLKNHLPLIQAQMKNKGIQTNTINIKKDESFFSQRTISTKTPPLLPKITPQQKVSIFSPRWTFSSFIQGPNNCFALSLAKSIAKQPVNNKTNPLFIYGPSGMGKTHLLHAIGNSLEKEKPHLRVRYLPSERFFNDCINHICSNKMSEFRQKYRSNTHILLLDDVQILGKGDRIQEEFFHTFESLKNSGCQIILVSDQKPSNIKGLKHRIKTRFEGGVITDIQAPDKDTKMAIIKKKCHSLQVHLSENIIEYISNIPIDSVRKIEGHLNKIKMFCELQNKALSLQLVQNLLPEETFLAPETFSLEEKVSIKDLQKHICMYFHIKLSDIKSKNRSQNMVLIRNLAIYLARKDLKMPLTEIGQHFGNRSHSTILNSLKNIEEQLVKNEEINKKLKHLRNLIYKK